MLGCIRCHWNCSHCQSQTQSCFLIRWNSQKPHWSGHLDHCSVVWALEGCKHIQMSRELFTSCTIKYKSLKMGASMNVICRDVKSLNGSLTVSLNVNVKKQSNMNIQSSKVNNATRLWKHLTKSTSVIHAAYVKHASSYC